MSEDEENVQNESEEQFKIEDLDEIYKSKDSLEKGINNNIQDDSIEDNANYNYISCEINNNIKDNNIDNNINLNEKDNNNINDKNNNEDIENIDEQNNDYQNLEEEINYNQLDNNDIIINEKKDEDNIINNINNIESNYINEINNYNEYPKSKEPEGPIKLIDFSHNDFILNENALNILNSIKEDLIIVSIVGKARTGKSYLMNLLLNNSNSSLPGSGFEISSRLNSCTKGIWLWNTPRSHPLFPDTSKIIFIDSEGTNSTDLSTKTYDSKIFGLIVLISSLFIYNTHGNIDERSIGDLALAAHISNTVATNVVEDKDMMINEMAPKFIWVLRDFILDKIDPETGKEISSNQYLELCLRNKVMNKNGVGMENNLIRENIIKYFKERECITLPRPVDQEEDLHKLNEIPFNQLKANFRSEFLNLKRKVYEESRVKRIGNKKVNGPILVELLTQFINSLNSKIIPNINTALDNIIINEIEKSYENSQKLWKQNYIKLKENDINNTRDIYNIKYNIMSQYSTVINENREIKYNKQFLEIYENRKLKLENEINNDIIKLNTKINNQKNSILNQILNKYENIDHFATIDINNLEKNQKNVVIKSLKINFNNFIKDIRNNLVKINNNEKIFDIILKKDKKNGIIAIKEILEITNREVLNILNDINEEIKEEKLYDKSNEINQFNTINETLNAKCDLLNEELDLKEKELSSVIGKYTKLMEKKEKIMANKSNNNRRDPSSLTMRSQRMQSDICGITVESNEKGCGCEIGDFCNIF